MNIIIVDFFKIDEEIGGVQTLFSNISKLFNAKLISVKDAADYFNINYERLRLDSNFEFNSCVLLDRYITELNKKEKIDLIIRNSLCTSFFDLGIKTINVINDNNVRGPKMLYEMKLYDENMYNNYLGYLALQYNSMRHANANVFVSRQIQEDYVKYFEEYFIKHSSKIITNSVDTNKFNVISNEEKDRIKEELEIPKDKKIVLWSGGAHMLKGYYKIIQPLLEKLPDYYFILVFKERLAATGTIPNTQLFSRISQELMIKLYNIADVTIIPSLIESFSLVALESMSCNTPIVMNKTGLAANYVEKIPGGMILEDWTPEAYVKAIEYVINNRKEFNPREFVMHNYSVEDFNKIWKSLVDGVLNEGN